MSASVTVPTLRTLAQVTVRFEFLIRFTRYRSSYFITLNFICDRLKGFLVIK